MKRQARRRGEIDMRTTLAKDAEDVQLRVIDDLGGETNIATTKLVMLQLLKSHIVRRGGDFA